MFQSFRRGEILAAVRRAYEDSGSEQAESLRHCAQVAWGLRAGNVARSRGYMQVAYRAQESLARESYTLGAASIGFADLKIHASASDANASRDYLTGFDESLTLFEVYRRLIAAGTTAIDVGANIGIHTLVMSRCAGEAGRVFAYEPSPAICQRFEENMILNGVRNITLRRAGAGARNGTLRFQPCQGEFNIGLGRFAADGPIQAEVVTLDSDLGPAGNISLVKIDVEGMELEVLRGARSLLERNRPALVMEYNASWTLRELREQLPYAARISSIPVTMLDRARNLDRASRCPVSTNILIEPRPAP